MSFFDSSRLPVTQVVSAGDQVPLFVQDQGVYMSSALATIASYVISKIVPDDTLLFEYVNSVSDLRFVEKTGPQFIATKNYWSTISGGGGVYYHDAADIISVDNGVTVIVANDGARWKLITDGKIHVSQAGAKGDGSNDATAIQAAINTGIKRVLFDGLSYKLTTYLSPISNQSWEGIPGQTTIETGYSQYLINTVNSTVSSDLTNTLASNSLKGSRTIVLSAGKGSNFSVGDVAFLQSEASMPGSITGKRGEHILIESISIDTLTINGTLRYDYLTAETALVRQITPVDNFSMSNIKLKCTDSVNHVYPLANFTWCKNLRLDNVSVEGSIKPGIQLAGCYNSRLTNIRGYDMLSHDVTKFGYVVVELGANKGLNLSDITTDRCRHSYTTAQWVAFGYGTAISSMISNGLALNSLRAGFDTHEDGDGITFLNCKTVGGNASGMQIRSVNTTVIGFYGIDLVGEGIYIDTKAVNTYIANVTLRNTNTGSYSDTSPTSRIERGCIFVNNRNGVIVDGAVVDNCGGPGIEGYSDYADGKFSNIVMTNVCQLAATNKYGINIFGTDISSIELNNVSVYNTDTKMNYGLKCNTNETEVRANNLFVKGHQTAKYLILNGVVSSNGINRLTFGKGKPVMTISAGVIDITDYPSSQIVVGGEGGADDDLVTITGGEEGDFVALIRTSQIITIKHGTGNIFLQSGVDKAMDAKSVIMLSKRGTYWIQPGF